MKLLLTLLLCYSTVYSFNTDQDSYRQNEKLERAFTRLTNLRCVQLKYNWITLDRIRNNEKLVHVNNSIADSEVKALVEYAIEYCERIEQCDTPSVSNSDNLVENNMCTVNSAKKLLLELLTICKYNKDYGSDQNSEQKLFLAEYIKAAYLRFCKKLDFPSGEKNMQEFLDFLFMMDNPLRMAVCDELYDKKDPKDCGHNKKIDKESYCLSSDPLELSATLFKYFYQQINENRTGTMNLKQFKFMQFKSNTDLDDADRFISKMKRMINGDENTLRNIKALKAIDIPLARELMMSNLLLNNFGRVLRDVAQRLARHCGHDPSVMLAANKSQFIPDCTTDEPWWRVKNILGKNDFKPLLRMHDCYTVIRIMLLVTAFAVNTYTLLVLKASSKYMPSFSVRLLELLLGANFLFLLTDSWMLMEEFYPLVPQGRIIEFLSMHDFDGDVWENITFFINLESVRMLMTYRYRDAEGDPVTEAQTHAFSAQVLLIFQNLLLNISRTYAATVLLSIMCYVLYELRKSYSGVLKIRIDRWFKCVLVGCFVAITGSYVLAGCFQYYVIHRIDSHLQTEHSELCSVVDSMTSKIQMHTYTMTVFYVITTLAIVTLFGYHKVQEVVAAPVSPSLKMEMRSTLMSLFVATVIYVVSNFMVTYTELSHVIDKSPIEDRDVAILTIRYHWLYLLSFADPIVHPLIIIYRMNAMLDTHRLWIRNIRRANISNFITRAIITLHRHRHPNRYSNQASQYSRFNDTYSTYNTEARKKRLSIFVQPVRNMQMDRDLNSMLHFLEEQRNPYKQ